MASICAIGFQTSSYDNQMGAAVAEWLSSWLAEQEDWGSIPGLTTWIFRDWLSPASKSRYGWKIAKSPVILKKPTNQPTILIKSQENNEYTTVFQEHMLFKEHVACRSFDSSVISPIVRLPDRHAHK